LKKLEDKLIYQGANTNLSLEDHKDFGTVLVKSLNNEYPSPQVIKDFQHEYELCKNLDIDGVRKVIDYEKKLQSHRIYLEYIDGISLSEYLSTKPNFREILKVFCNLVEIVSRLHQKSIIHNRLSLQNILVKTDTLSVFIIDFSESTTYSKKSTHMGNPEKLDGDIRYMAPEQTGRMNRITDHRSDLYTIGIMLYEFISGQPPFNFSDPLELVHAQIAIQPKPLTDFNPNCPQVLEQIVLKLLQKNADKRYQSASGLHVDLNDCLDLYKKNNEISTFKIAQKDIYPGFRLSQKLYGRDLEIEKLISTFEKTAKGETHLLMVTGYSGTGKSALVSEIYKPITSRKGYFVGGKFDQYQRAIPYYAILKAFDALIHILLTENESKLERIKTDMLGVLGQEGKVLTDVMPSLEMIIGKQPPVAEVSGEDAQNRFKYVFQKWLSVLCTEQHPIVLFIDDLQWADSSSLDLLETLMLKKDNHFFCIGAYRDNEVSSAHPLSITLNDIREIGVRLDSIHLDNLSLNNLEELLQDSLLIDRKHVKSLAELVHQKTRGNAFFVVQFLKNLAEKSLLNFNFKQRQWEWDINEIKKQNITDNVVLFMADKIKELSEETQKIIKVAACLGNIFDIARLRTISNLDENKISKELESLLIEGLIVKLENSYKFAHDRIQQAVYSLIQEEDRIALHYKIGQTLWKKSEGDELEGNIFEVVNHINWGIRLIDDLSKRLSIAKLNLRASEKAKLTSAFSESFSYIKSAIKLLPENSWKTHYDLRLKIYEEAAESAFLDGKFEEMHLYIDEILDNAKDLLSRVKPYEIRINAYKAENKLKEALNTGLDILKQLGERFPKKPSMLTIFPDLIKTVLKLRNKKLEDILELPDANDPVKIASIRILATIAPSSYWGNPTIFPHIIFRMCQLSLKHGVTAASAFGFATYGVIMIGVLNKIKTGYPYGKIGLALIKRFNAKEWVAQVYTPVYALINIWNGHIKHTLSPLLDSYHIGLETGAIEFSCINANIYSIHAYVIGKPLDKLEPEIKDYSNIIKQHKQETNFMYNEIFRQSALNFMGKAEDYLKLKGEAFDEDKLFEQGITDKNRTITFMIYCHRSILGNYFGHADFAFENSLKAEELLDAVLGKIEVALQSFHSGLAAANVSSGKFSMAKSKLKKSIKKLKHWSKNAPENFEHKLYLLQAEKARLSKEHNKARDLYDLSINSANKHNYIQEAALASEMAGRYHMQNKNSTLSRFYIRNAYQLYRDWGATAKLYQLAKAYPNELKGLVNKQVLAMEALDLGNEFSLSSLDLQSVFKVSTALSGEVVFEKMLRQLMHIMSENIGANKAALVLSDKDELNIAARWTVDQKETSIEKIPLHKSEILPKTIINYIERTKKQVILGDARQDQIYGKDPYLQKHKIKSVLATPLINKGNFQGILYLENNLLNNAFNTENVKFLNLLTSQIAVSIENAMLYDNLEKKVIERTSELADEKKKSEDLLLNILPAETALELKKFGKAKPRRYESVSVIFTDFKDFTKKSEKMTPEELVVQVDRYFTKFDEISQKYNIEKIKTIGDSYLCVSGLPIVDKSHATNAIMAALEMRDYVESVAESKGLKDPSSFRVRIGIHSGPVVSGVVGFKKFAFDIWGDTVNTASRLENECESSKINISHDTYLLVKDQFKCEYRGKLKAKNKGEIDMYYVNKN
jgi:predicted ATPase/class 3 adenylate cyclase/tRNA A-37 threonylcarbamoyl transferase component Bud32